MIKNLLIEEGIVIKESFLNDSLVKKLNIELNQIFSNLSLNGSLYIFELSLTLTVIKGSLAS